MSLATAKNANDVCTRWISPRLAWTVALGYALVLTYLLVVSHPLWFLGGGGETTEEAIDQTVSGYTQHVIAYALQGFLLVCASATGTGPRAVVCIVCAVTHGMLGEGIQYFVPDRFFDGFDALANGAGALIGWAIAWSVIRVVAAKNIAE